MAVTGFEVSNDWREEMLAEALPGAFSGQGEIDGFAFRCGYCACSPGVIGVCFGFICKAFKVLGAVRIAHAFEVIDGGGGLFVECLVEEFVVFRFVGVLDELNAEEHVFVFVVDGLGCIRSLGEGSKDGFSDGLEGAGVHFLEEVGGLGASIGSDPIANEGILSVALGEMVGDAVGGDYRIGGTIGTLILACGFDFEPEAASNGSEAGVGGVWEERVVGDEFVVAREGAGAGGDV